MLAFECYEVYPAGLTHWSADDTPLSLFLPRSGSGLALLAQAPREPLELAAARLIRLRLELGDVALDEIDHFDL